MDLLDFLTKSRGRKLLLRAVLQDGVVASVRELAHRCDVAPKLMQDEVARMAALGLLLSERRGAATVVRVNPAFPHLDLLRALLVAKVDVATPERDVQLVRSWLAHYGAQFVSFVVDQEPPPVEVAIAAGLRVAHDDPAMLGTLPVVLWKCRDRLDLGKLAELARREGEAHTLGFLLELTDYLSGESRFAGTAATLRDRRVKRLRNFFSRGGELSPWAAELVELQTPALARRWNLLMNMSLDSFVSYFRKGVTPGVSLQPT